MPKKETWYFIFAALGGFGGLACILQWLGITPKDLAMTKPIAAPHILWLLVGLGLFAASLWSTLRAAYFQKRTIAHLKDEASKREADLKDSAKRNLEYRAQLDHPASDAKPSRLQILDADYRAMDGRGDGYNVTKCLQKMVRGDALVLDITNHAFEVDGINYVPKDPFYGVIKILRIKYSFDGVFATPPPHPEGSRIVLPEDTFIASAIAGIPNIPFSQLQIQAFQLARDIREFLRTFEPMPPQIDGRTQDEQTRIRLMTDRVNWRQKLHSSFELRFEERLRKMTLEFGAIGIPLDLSHDRSLREIADVIAWKSDAITAAAHRIDGAKLAAG